MANWSSPPAPRYIPSSCVFARRYWRRIRVADWSWSPLMPAASEILILVFHIRRVQLFAWPIAAAAPATPRTRFSPCRPSPYYYEPGHAGPKILYRYARKHFSAHATYRAITHGILIFTISFFTPSTFSLARDRAVRMEYYWLLMMLIYYDSAFSLLNNKIDLYRYEFLSVVTSVSTATY